MMRRIVLLGGAPGVGKSACAHALREHVRAVIEIDALWAMHGAPDWTSAEQFTRALVMASNVVRAFEGVGDVVLVAPWTMEQRAAFYTMQWVDLFVALTCSESVLRDRLSRRAGRSASAFNDADRAVRVNAEHETVEGHVDTSALWSTAVAARVLCRMRGGAE